MRTYTPYSLVLLGLVWFSSAFCYSQEVETGNTIDEASQKIRRDFRTKADEAMVTFKAEMTSIIKKVAENGTLDDVQLLVDQRDLFLEKQDIPPADGFQAAKAYKLKVNAELSKVQQLYEAGIQFRVQELDLANAKNLRTEIAEIENGIEPTYLLMDWMNYNRISHNVICLLPPVRLIRDFFVRMRKCIYQLSAGNRRFPFVQDRTYTIRFSGRRYRATLPANFSR